MKWTQTAILGLIAATAAGSAQAADTAAGEKIFRQCMACHSWEQGKNGVGPSLYGLVGRPSASIDGFRYSEAMKNANLVWTRENLERYLRDPGGTLPGVKMVFKGLTDQADIDNVLAFIESKSN